MNKLLKYLFKATTIDDIFQFKGNKVKVGGVEYGEKQARELRNEAQMLTQLQIWKHLTDSIKYTANKQMFEESKSFDDMFFGKACLYVVDLQEKLLEKIKKIN